MTSPLSPEAVAQMVAEPSPVSPDAVYQLISDLQARQSSWIGDGSGPDKLCHLAATALHDLSLQRDWWKSNYSTLAAENATLRERGNIQLKVMADTGDEFDRYEENAETELATLRASEATLATQLAEREKELARVTVERDDCRDNFRTLERAIIGDTGLSAMLVATQAKLFRPRAISAETELSTATARIAALTEALKPFADIGIPTNPDYRPEIRLDRDVILAARAALTTDKGAAS